MSMPYFALYPVDFLADVGHLGNTELGIYWRLLLVYYRDGRPLPCDSDRLRRIAMAFSPEECRILDAVVSEFFTLTTEPDGTRVWRNKRADQEIERALTIYSNKVAGAEKARAMRAARQAAGGVIGAGATQDPAPGEQVGGSSDIRPDVKPTSTGESEPEPEPDSSKRGVSLAAGAAGRMEYPAEFEAAWKEYPPRPGSSKKLSFKAWSARLKEGVKPETLLEAVKRYAAYCVAERKEPQFTLDPATFFGPNERYAADWTPKGTISSGTKSIAGMNYSEGVDEHGNIL